MPLVHQSFHTLVPPPPKESKTNPEQWCEDARLELEFVGEQGWPLPAGFKFHAVGEAGHCAQRTTDTFAVVCEDFGITGGTIDGINFLGSHGDKSQSHRFDEVSVLALKAQREGFWLEGFKLQERRRHRVEDIWIVQGVPHITERRIEREGEGDFHGKLSRTIGLSPVKKTSLLDMKAILMGTVVAEAPESELVQIEGNWYFPPSALKPEFFTNSPTPYTCPWKGVCQYHTLTVDGQSFPDRAWSYPEPFPGAVERVGKDFAGYVAFWKEVSVES